MDFISILREELPRFKKILDLGSKKGEHLQQLHEYYEVIASENQKNKTRYLKDNFIDIRVIVLDNIILDTHKRFDCIFSKNSLEMLTLDNLDISLDNQKKILNKNGLIFHIFDINKINKNKIINLISEKFEILNTDTINNDFFVCAKLN